MMTKAKLVAYLDRIAAKMKAAHDDYAYLCHMLPNDLKARVFADPALGDIENTLSKIEDASKTLANQLAREVDREAA